MTPDYTVTAKDVSGVFAQFHGLSTQGDGIPEELDEDGEVRERTPFQAPASKPTATGSGRVVPEAKAPVVQTGSANRPQPSRQPRSKRGK